ncbi:MAG TPA: hypothetical protein VNV37_06470, partial [Solirubrobacteraceae bacterium]|nr:hypothetical protein [Solirubrobacteraceae bacterium]
EPDGLTPRAHAALREPGGLIPGAHAALREPPPDVDDAAAAARARHVWERSGPALRTVALLRAGRIAVAPAGVRRTPTYARDFAQRLCELLAQECDGVFNMAGPTIIGRLAQTRMLARTFDCEPDLVRDGPLGPLPPNTALCDRRASFVLGRPGVDPFGGLRLMRGQLERLLGSASPPSAPRTPEVLPLVGQS